MQYIQFVGDLLRGSVVCADFDLVALAWTLISDEHGFDVRPDHGRLKNNLLTTEARPPDMLINVSVDLPGITSMMGEIQIHLRDIITAKEEMHHVYEVVRASRGEELLGEASMHADAHAKIEPAADERGDATDGGARRSVTTRAWRAARRNIARALRSPPTGPQTEGTGPVRSPLQEGAGCEMVTRRPADADPEQPPIPDDAGLEERPTTFAGENPLTAHEPRHQSI